MKVIIQTSLVIGGVEKSFVDVHQPQNVGFDPEQFAAEWAELFPNDIVMLVDAGEAPPTAPSTEE